jgi:hypothetical protein
MASVLSAWPVWLVLPVMFAGRGGGWRDCGSKLAGATAACLGVFLLFNPFLVFNLLFHRSMLVSNLANSTAMYSVGDLTEGAANVAKLSFEAAGPAVLAAGILGGLWLYLRRRWEVACLLLPGAAVLGMMASLGAGKPGEFGRFGVFAYAVLALLAGCGAAVLAERRARLGLAVVMLLVAGTTLPGMRYLRGFCVDAYGRSSRAASAEWIADRLVGRPRATIGVVQEPAPYAMGPLDFANRRVILLPRYRPPSTSVALPDWLVVSADSREALYGSWWLEDYEVAATFPSEPLGLLDRPTVISWANKPIFIFRRRRAVPFSRLLMVDGHLAVGRQEVKRL